LTYVEGSSMDVIPKRPKASQLVGLLRLMRPAQSVKNIFVLAAVLFSGRLGDVDALRASFIAFIAFCLWSSAIYCLNDVLDAKADRAHPRKCRRPIPAGDVSPNIAFLLAATLAIGGVALSFALPPGFLLIGSLYVANSILYSVFLKHRVIVDVIMIAIGFVLRLLGGCEAVGVQASPWIVVCGFSLALLLGFGKRRLEIGASQLPESYRPTLQSYTAEKLNMLLGATSAVCLLAYMLYTVSPETIQLHGTNRLVYTVPFVAYGIFRYLFKVQEGKYDGPVEVLLRDYVFVLNGFAWMSAVLIVLYFTR
jgi:4-hydroxybenzoate polyprenyltransferase